MENIDLLEAIEEYVKKHRKTPTISLGYNPTSDKTSAIEIAINEDVDFNDIHEAIDIIVDNVVDNDFAYELIDYMLDYYIIKLFTNIPVPMDGDSPDYEQCIRIAVALDLMNELGNKSDLVRYYIDVLNKNIWRKLEYRKALTSILPFNELMSALANFYEIMDAIEEGESEEGRARLMSDLENLQKSVEIFNERVSEIKPQDITGGTPVLEAFKKDIK